MMDTERWQQVRKVFEEAASLPAAERTAYLDEACAGDAELRREVDSLLTANDDEAPFLDQPLSLSVLLPQIIEDEAGRPGVRIGPYQIVRALGKGGMGTVYLADRADGQFDQKVALKVIRAGMATDEIERRFLQERQILARLQHPNIARLLDGGMTVDGKPYFAMEYIEGVPITTYCDENRLDVAARLGLYKTVCQAVHFAHQNLVVHRDLKPSNILVTPDGRVKLLDFGIARVLLPDEEAEHTLTSADLRVMTPEYAAPEQVRGEPVTTATDVYSLGIVLYELLTGHRPYQFARRSASEIERVVCEQEPERLSTIVAQTKTKQGSDGSSETITPEVVSEARSTHPKTLRRRLGGDLDTMVLKALRKEPNRRYSSAEAFMEDIRRYLDGLTIVARPDTFGYRFSKFLQRNTIVVAATTLIAIVLLGGIIATVYQSTVSQRRFDDIRALSNTLLFELHDDIRDLPGATSARRTLVTYALTYLDKLNREAENEPSLQLELAEAYERIGRIQGDPHYTNLGDLAGTIQSYRTSLRLREEVWNQDPSNRTVQQALATSYGHLAVATGWSSATDTSIELGERALELLSPILADSSRKLDALHDEGRIRSEQGWRLIFRGQMDEGLAYVDSSLHVLESIAPQLADDKDLQVHLWRAYSYRVDGLRFTDRYQEALDLLNEKAIPHLHALEKRWPTLSRVQYGLHIGYDYIGTMNQALGDLNQAIPAYEASYRYAEEMVKADSTNRKGHEAQARALVSLGYAYGALDRVDDAVAAYRRAIEIRWVLVSQNPENEELGDMLGSAYRFLCRILVEKDRLTDALQPCHVGVEVQEGVASDGEMIAVRHGNLGSMYAYTARLHRLLAGRVTSLEERQNHEQEALAWYERGVATLSQVKQLIGDTYTTLAWEVHPDSLASEHEAFARMVAGQ